MSTLRIHWGWAITAVYSCFALATLGFVGFALTQEVDLVRPDYYEHSLLHDQRMRARTAAASLSDASVTITSQVLRIQVPVDHAQATGVVALYHPSTAGDDRSIPLQMKEQGLMELPVDRLVQGKWIITVTWKHRGVSYEIEKEFTRGAPWN